jgi:hypothetical protein
MQNEKIKRVFSKRVASAIGGSASGGKEQAYARHSYQGVRFFMLYLPKKTSRFFELTPFYSPSLRDCVVIRFFVAAPLSGAKSRC